MPLVKLTLWHDPVEVPENEIPALRGERLYQYVVGGGDDPNKSAPAKAAPSSPKEK